MVTVGERRSLAAASRHCAGSVRLPTGTPGYAEALRAELARGGYATFFPASDVAMLAVDDPAAALVDKAVLDERARAAGFDCLPTEVFASAADLLGAAGRLAYPLVVKSVTKSGLGNLQARRVTGPEELTELAGSAPGRLVVQPFDDSPLRAVSGVVHQGRLLASCAQTYQRIWPPAAGVASAAVSVLADPDEEARLTRLLAAHDGVFQVQFLGPYLLDVNPRVYGSMALAIAAGANLPLIAADAAAGQLPDATVRAKPGVPYRWWEGDLRYVVNGLRSRSLGPRQAAAAPRRAAHRSERGTALGSVPTVSRLVHALGRKGRGRPTTRSSPPPSPLRPSQRRARPRRDGRPRARSAEASARAPSPLGRAVDVGRSPPGIALDRGVPRWRGRGGGRTFCSAGWWPTSTACATQVSGAADRRNAGRSPRQQGPRRPHLVRTTRTRSGDVPRPSRVARRGDPVRRARASGTRRRRARFPDASPVLTVAADVEVPSAPATWCGGPADAARTRRTVAGGPRRRAGRRGQRRGRRRQVLAAGGAGR